MGTESPCIYIAVLGGFTHTEKMATVKVYDLAVPKTNSKFKKKCVV